ncbi:conserved phage C-terminal domain-containing protein [Enterobacter hormaechei]|uniref:conserved phage C-terminal domain-containing protein n=1 Tax=Enterobacter hormaechei TaxID=158836 RepID=UPI003B7F5717
MSRIFDIVQSMSGQKNVIVLPRPYLQFFKEDQQAHALAAVLNNLVFWSAFGSEDGWFYKTHKELGLEAGELTEDQTERLVKKLVNKYFPGVIETCSRKVNGTPTKHYRIDGESLISLIFPENNDPAKVRNGKRENAELKPRKRESQTANDGNHGGRENAESYLYTDFNAELNKQTNKPSCPVAPQPDREVLITDQAKVVLNHLNKVTNSRYQVSTTSLQNIRARIGEGFTVDELVLVVDYSNAKWGDDLKMSDYLRPQTLFQPSKFPGYLKSANNWNKANRPQRVNGEWSRQDGVFKSSFQNTDYSEIPAGFRGAN